MPKEGEEAPDFKLRDQNGEDHSLSQYLGQWVLVYFYPKDDTPGCTKEACGIRDNFPDFENLKIKVLGVSVDSVQNHKQFAEKYHLPFTLLADENREVVQKYCVWGEKNTFGHKSFGTLRTSFLVSPEGKIAKVYTSVKPEVHAQEVLEDLE
ncbi:MAG TPA: thioredoxin-dependent thiol peroxidase [bacterium]|nr:thioredoxin-dependent thiol peroxidase [bacterium]